MLLGWPVACMMLATLPLIFGSGRFMVRFIRKYTVLSQQSYAEAGVFAEQAFQSIRTVYAFSLQNRFIQRYEKKLDQACDYGVKKGVSMGAGFSLFMFFLFCSFGLALWYGSSKVIDGTLTGPEVFVSFVSMMMGKKKKKRMKPNFFVLFLTLSYRQYEFLEITCKFGCCIECKRCCLQNL